MTVRHVAITGAASGLGAATRALLEADAVEVLGVDVRGSDVDADLSTGDGRRRAVEAAIGWSPALDGLVCCAGLGPQVADTATVVSVNHFGAIEVLDRLTDALALGDAPSVVLISSNSVTLDPTIDASLVDACVAGDEDRARSLAASLPGNTVYASSKQALARSLRRRVQPLGARGIRANAVAPGPFDSPLLQGGLDDPVLRPLIEAVPIPIGARGAPADVAAAVVWLLSGAARYVHGSVLLVDGGTDALLFPDRVP